MITKGLKGLYEVVSATDSIDCVVTSIRPSIHPLSINMCVAGMAVDWKMADVHNKTKVTGLMWKRVISGAAAANHFEIVARLI